MSISNVVNCKFSIRCTNRWEDLQSGAEDDSTRFCRSCERTIHLASDQYMLDKLIDAGESAVVLKKSLSAIVPDSLSGSENHVGVSADLETSRPTPVLELKLLRLRHGARVILTDIDEHNIRPFVPGFVLNGAEPGNDGCIFTIEEYRNRRDRWNLFRFSFPDENDRSFAFGDLVGEGLTVHRLYRELARLDLFLLGHETIALGLPYCLDPWTGD